MTAPRRPRVLVRRGAAVLNFDCQPPLNPDQRALWRKGDLMDAADVAAALAKPVPPETLLRFVKRYC